MSDEDNEKKTGPGNPPKEFRWQKGDPSPNPRGRPRKRDIKQVMAPLDRYAEMVDRFGSQEVRSLEGSIELRESYIRALAEIAFDKKAPAKVRADILKTLTVLDREAQAVLEKEKEKQFNAALNYKEEWTGRFRAAERAGRKVPSALPHPDDIIIHGSRVLIVGPTNADEQARLDILLFSRKSLKKAYEVFLAGSADENATRFFKYARRELAKINKQVPPRLIEAVPPLPQREGGN